MENTIIDTRTIRRRRIVIDRYDLLALVRDKCPGVNIPTTAEFSTKVPYSGSFRSDEHIDVFEVKLEWEEEQRG